jgi:hypothetical protein
MMTLDQARFQYYQRTAVLKLWRGSWRKWDRMTPDERRAQHERFETICAALDREKTEGD